MIIVSQDKDNIINFDNIKMISREEKIISIDANLSCGAFYSIAEYSTEERAKEVLQEIISKYSSYLQLNGGPAIIKGQMDIQPNIFNIPKIYEMPEE